MFRANLHLHPHPNSQSKLVSAPPGAFPTFPNIVNNGSDFSRTIVLTPEKPIQPIGRSSRNTSKGLVADRNNGFFESAVMSRAHAEVRLILEPERKIIIKDTKSMHGTFVNGLQLVEDETAELRQDTEVTFGCEVTRGDEVFPPKTFRCDIEWEDMSPPRLSEPSSACLAENSEVRGYGVTAEDLTYHSGEEFDEEEEGEEEEEEEDDEDDAELTFLDIPASDEGEASSSGESSSPSSPTGSPVTQTIKPVYVGASTSKAPYYTDEDIPVSHERSTKDMPVDALTKDSEREEQLKRKVGEMISRTGVLPEPNYDFSGVRTITGQRVSIGSLMNKTADSNAHYQSEKEGNSVEAIPNEAFLATTKPKSSSESKSKKPIIIEDDDVEMFYEHGEMASTDFKDGDEQDEDEDDDGDEQMSCDDEEDRDEEDDEEGDEEEEDEEEEEERGGDDTCEGETKKRGSFLWPNFYGATDTRPQAEQRPVSSPAVATVCKTSAAPLDSLLAPTPSKMSFRSSIDDLTHAAAAAAAAVAAIQAPTPISIPKLPPLSKIHPDAVVKKTPSGASHIHWLGDTQNQSPFPQFPDMALCNMERKKEYFEAREINATRIRGTRTTNEIHSDFPQNLRSGSKSPPVQPYIVDGAPWVHGSKSNETPEEAACLFPAASEPEPYNQIKNMVNEAMPSPPATITSQAKKLSEDAVPIVEKNKEAFETRFPNWWPECEVAFDTEANSEVRWEDEEVVNDQDGEYDEEDEDMEQDPETGAEEDMEDANLEDEFDEEYEDDPESEFEEQQDDDIRTDLSEYGSSYRMDEAPTTMPKTFNLASASITSSDNSLFGRTSASEAGKGDFTKSRGFSISNLVNESAVTPRPQSAVTSAFYPARPTYKAFFESSGTPLSKNASPVSPPQVRKENSMADILNPSSPAAGSKRKHEDISSISQDELQVTNSNTEDNVGVHDIDLLDDELEGREVNGEEGSKMIPMPFTNLARGGSPFKKVPAITANTAVQVSAADIKLAGTEGEIDSEPPRKKQRTHSSGRQIAKYAATALVSAIVGGVGVFAALVASAPVDV